MFVFLIGFFFRTTEKTYLENEKSKESAEKSGKEEKIKRRGLPSLRSFLKVKDENAHPNLAFDESHENLDDKEVKSDVPSPSSQ